MEKLSFFIGSTRLSASKYANFPFSLLLISLQLISVALPDTTSRYLLPSGYGVFLSDTMIEIALVVAICCTLVILADVFLEFVVLRSIQHHSRLTVLSIAMRYFCGILIIPIVQILSAVFILDDPSSGSDLANVLDSLGYSVTTVVVFRIFCGMLLAGIVALAVLDALTHFSFGVTDLSILRLQLPTHWVVAEPIILVSFTILATTRCFSLMSSSTPFVAIMARLIVAGFALAMGIIHFVAPSHGHPTVWATHVTMYLVAGVLALVPIHSTVLVVPVILVAVFCSAAFCLAKLAMLHLRLRAVLVNASALDDTEEAGTPANTTKSILKSRADLNISETTPPVLVPRTAALDFYLYVFSAVALRKLYSASMRHSSDRLEMLSLENKNEAKFEHNFALLSSISSTMRFLCSEKYLTARDRLVLVQFAMSVAANIEVAVRESIRIHTMIERDMIQPLGPITASLFQAVQADLNNIRRRHDSGIDSETLAGLNKKQQRAREETQHAKRAIHRFWQALDCPNPDVNSLLSISNEIFRHVGQADELYVHLIKSFPERDSLIRTYAEFIENVRQDGARAKVLYNIADEIVQRKRKDESSDASESSGSKSRQSSLASVQLGETSILTALRSSGSMQNHSTIMRLRVSVQILLVILGLVFISSTAIFQARSFLLGELIDLTYLACTTGAGAVEGSSLATLIEMQSTHPEIVSEWARYSSTELSDEFASIVSTLRSDSDDIKTATSNVIMSTMFDSIYTVMHSRASFSTEYGADTPLVPTQSTTSLAEYLSSMAVRFERMKNNAATDTDLAYIRDNSVTNFLAAALFSARQARGSLDFIAKLSLGMDAALLVIVIVIIISLQFFLLRRAFRTVIRKQTENINLFLHISRAVVDQMVRVTVSKGKKVRRIQMPQRRAITFSEHVDDSHFASETTELDDLPTQKQRTRFADEDDASVSDNTEDTDSEEVADTNMFQAKLIDSVERLAVSTPDTSSRTRDSRIEPNSAEADFILALEGEARKLQAAYLSRRVKLQYMWVVIIGATVSAALTLLGTLVLLGIYVILTPTITETYEEVATTRLALDDFVALCDTQTWAAFTFAHTADISAFDEYYSVVDGRMKDDVVIELSEYGLPTFALQTIAQSKTTIDQIAYQERVALKLVDMASSDLTSAVQCQSVGFQYDYSTETRYPLEVAEYESQRSTDQFLHGMYTSTANDSALSPDTMLTLARVIMSDPSYWDQKTAAQDAMTDMRDTLSSDGISDASSLESTQLYVGLGAAISLLCFICAVALLVVAAGVALLLEYTLRIIDSYRLTVQQHIFTCSQGHTIADFAFPHLTQRPVISDPTGDASITTSADTLGPSASQVGSILSDMSPNSSPARKKEARKPAILGFSVLAVLLAVVLAATGAAITFAVGLLAETMTISTTNDSRDAILGLVSCLSQHHRELLRDARVFSQFGSIIYAFQYSTELGACSAPENLVVKTREVGVAVEAAQAAYDVFYAMQHIQQVSLQLGLWAWDVSDSIVANLHGYDYSFDDDEAEMPTATYDRPHLYSTPAADAGLSSDEQQKISRYIIFDEYFDYLVKKFDASLGTVQAATTTYYSGVIDDELYRLYLVAAGVAASTSAAALVLAMIFLTTVRIAAPKPPGRPNIIKQRANMARTNRYYRIATLSLLVIGALFGLLTIESSAGYFIVHQSETIAQSAQRLIDFFSAMSVVVPIASEAQHAARFFTIFEASVADFQALHDDLDSTNDPLLHLTNMLRASTSADNCDNCTYVSDTSLDSMIALFVDTANTLSPDAGGSSCIAPGGFDNIGFQTMLELHRPMATVLWAELDSYYQFITLAALIHQMSNLPLVAGILIILVLAYRFVFRRIFKALQHDEEMVHGLLKMIPRDGMGAKSLLMTYLSELLQEEGEE
ncbi:hypothetical protein J8273_2918 [Carpediemonas membranifera]|uniref:TmcB/TmcC TPR repeats domain-containing protein n=1 Tax=Carpediemonas membranifera TaxID=201153 RepID=A0A8J6AY75_9EUKA|nr:hypothetical protein J8273_2918 [Carpediemonas membranifera]|eukprot:KAG9395360.1 hypothetical protein J8273_2918 [Carpediemonas membranifera]